jgi:hypothetical protein
VAFCAFYQAAVRNFADRGDRGQMRHRLFGTEQCIWCSQSLRQIKSVTENPLVSIDRL